MGEMTIAVADRRIGDGQPCFLIAEAGVNHNGRVEIAHQLVEVAASAHADAMKFQKRTVSEILIREYLDRPYDVPTSLGATYGEHRLRLELGPDAYRVLKADAEARGLIFLASAWDAGSVRFLEELGIAAYKTASADLTNLPLLDTIARLRKPMFVSTGMSEMHEVEDALATIRRHHDQVVLLQCTSTYPSENANLNLRVMRTYRERLDCLVGYSGHERGLAPTEAAVALGACVVERHFTLDRTMTGPDHAASLEPDGLRRLVRNVRNIEAALGDGVKRLIDAERPVRARLAKSIVTARAIRAGSVIEADMLAVKGPGIGIAPRHLPDLVGRVAAQDVPADSLVPADALSWPRSAAVTRA